MGTVVNSYDLVGKKEDISNIISMISPTKYPFTTMTGSGKVTQTYFEWMEDKLRDAAENAQVEGFTATPTARSQPQMRGNVTQIMQDTFEVTGTSDVVTTYGRAKDSARQAAKAAEALKKDLEHAYVGTGQAMVKPTDNSSARKFAGVQAQIDETMYVYTGGSSTAMDEPKLLEAIQKCYDEGSDPDTIMVTPTRSLTVADFAKASGRSRQIPNGGSDRKIVNVVDLYVSPFGQQKVVLNRHLKAGDTLVFEPAMWERQTLRPWSRETLAKTGDSTKMMIVGEFSLKHANAFATAIVREAAAA